MSPTTGLLDSCLMKKENYLNELNKLSARLKKEPRLWANAPVVDDLSLGKILTEPDKTISILIEQISGGAFQFQDPKVIQLATADKVRKVTIWPWPERIVLMVLQRALTLDLEKKFSKSLFSFIKGRSTLHAKNKLKKFLEINPEATIAKRDISGYGDTISAEKLYAMLAGLIDFETNPKAQKIIKSALGNLPVGIPTGSPLTPFFENVYLMPMDQLFEGLCQGRHFYARYGDDFVFASLDPAWITLAEEKSDALIQQLGLSVAAHKKTTLKFKDRIESLSWLGSAFKKHGLVTSRKKHSDQVYTDFKKYFSQLTYRLSKTHSIAAATPILQTALDQYLSHRDNGSLSKVIIHRNDAVITKMIDSNVKFFLAKWITQYFKLNKRSAWKTVRSLEVPSLNYQRRFLYRLGKYE